MAPRDFLHAFGTGYLIMPYYEGDTLRGFHEKRGGGALPWREVLPLTLPIVDALRAVHEVGVIHRDVKPANIYLARNSAGVCPLLLDFGAARVTGSALQFTAVLTERYAPLEQYDWDATKQGAWTDIYAIAATILELLTGERLPTAPSRQLGAPLPVLEAFQADAPHQLTDALEHALRVDPLERTRDASTLYAALRQALDVPPAARTRAAVAPQTTPVKHEIPSPVTSAPVTSMAAPPTKRGWRLAAALGGSVLAIALASAFWLADTTTPPARQHDSQLPSLPTAPTQTGQPRGGATPPILTRDPGGVREPVRPPKTAKTNSAQASTTDRRMHDRDSAEKLLERGDYTAAWVRASAANSPDLLRRIGDACRGDSLIAARRSVTVGCPH